MNNSYANVLKEANNLIGTYTIRYDVGKYSEDLYSSTYDDISKWVRNALVIIEANELNGRESELYKNIRRFRGRAGDLTLKELKNIISLLEALN
ncbi:hypothetical protein [Desnuesiella massiliensis]|uniref:hypothetical protein n=1 Tax=Desnuesiella massiliensis TaxID=1650662 RepID=UPI0006E12AB8|nr:hypothetical protein [Desnuesiella massiliensis]